MRFKQLFRKFSGGNQQARSRIKEFRERRAKFEKLELRQLLASDLIVDAPNRDVELQMIGDMISVIDLADDSILGQSRVDDIEDLVQISSRSFLADSLLELDGNSLQVYADTIELTGTEIRTTDFEDTEAAGSLLFEAREIHVLAGAKLDTQVAPTSARTAGRITLSAVDRISQLNRFFQETALPVVGDARSSSLEIVDSMLLGGDITLDANGNTVSRYDDVAAYQDSIASGVLDALQQAPQILMSAVAPLSGQVKIHDASASIVITDSSVTSSSWIDLDASAIADSSINALAVNGINGRFMGAVGFSSSSSSASIDLLGTTRLNAAGYIDIETSAISTAETKTRSEGGSQFSASEVDYAFNLALALTNEVSSIEVAPGVTITSEGYVNLDAQGEVTNKAKADTALFQDGEAAFSVAVGVDNAEVVANVAGTITSRDLSNVRSIPITPANVLAGSNQIRLVTPAKAQVRIGERMIYVATANENLGLVDGAEYIVSEATEPVPEGSTGNVSQLVRLTRARSIDLDPRQVPEGSEHTLRKVAVVEFPVSAVSAEPGTSDGLIEIGLNDLPAAVNEVIYLGPDNPKDDDGEKIEGIAGLQQNQRYEVVRQGQHIKLRRPGSSAFLDFDALETDGPNHGFRFYERVFSFHPRNAVDGSKDSIELPGDHGLSTGDLLVYGVDPARSIAREVAAFDNDENRVGRLGDVTLPDAPIRGLENNLAYRVIVDSHDPTKVRLGTSLVHALLAETANLESTSGDQVGRLERVELPDGIRINAHLDATNFAQAGVNLTDGDQPWPALIQGAANGQIDDIAQLGFAFVESLQASIDETSKVQAESGAGTDSGSKLDAAGSLSVTLFDHIVEAKLTGDAVLKSVGDLTVEATTEQAVKLGVTAESTRNALNGGGNDTEFAVGVGVGVYNTTTHAIVDDFAELDAVGDTRVAAAVTYPLLTEAEGNQQTVSTGLAGFNAWLSGQLDFSNLTNVYSRTIATGSSEGDDKVLALGGGVALTFTKNDVLAQIGGGAQINQDTNYFNPARSVEVTADLDATIIEVGQMMSVNLSAPGIAEAITNGTSRQNPDVTNFLTDLVNPFGISGDKAFGGTLLVNTTENSVVAEIEAGAAVRAQSLEVLANSDYYNFAGVQTGTGAIELGFSAAIAASNLDVTTTAAIHEDAAINVTLLNVSAHDNLDRITYAGAVLKGEQAGIGTSIGVNIVEQNVAAFIGREDKRSQGDPSSVAPLYAVGSARIAAEATGTVEAIAISGALQGLGGSKSDANSNQTGPIAITAPVAYNALTTDVDAYVDNQDIAEVGSLDVSGHAETSTKALVLGGSFAVQTAAGANSGKLNLAGAGAVGINKTHQTVDATIHDSLVTALGDVTVTATEASEVTADAGGLAVAFGSGPKRGAALSFGASVAINDVSGHTRAIVDRSQLTMIHGDTDLTVSAASLSGESEDASGSRVIGLALGGAASASLSPALGSFGGLGAAVQNRVNKSVRAEIFNNSIVELATGAIHVLARDESQIVADAGGLSLSGGVATKINGVLGIGLAFNEVENSTIARIADSTVSSEGSILVQANVPSADSAAKPATVDALSVAGSIGLAGNQGLSASLAGAGAGSNNQVRNTITAEIVGSDVESFSSTIDVQSFDQSSIVATTVGAAIDVGIASGLSGAVSVGLSIARNEIANTTTAKIEGGRVSTSENDGSHVYVHAADDATIEAVAVAASLAVSAAVAPAFSLSGGGAEASNVILSDLDALVQDAEIASAALSVTSDSSATIQSDVVGVTSSVAGSAAAGAGASIGASVANNLVGYRLDGSQEDARSHAEVRGSTIDVAQLRIESDSVQDIDATTFVGAYVVAATGDAGAAAAGSGARTTNRIGSSILAKLDGSLGSVVDVSDRLTLAATDQTKVHANTTATTVAGFVGGGAGGAIQIGISLAENLVTNRVESLLTSATFADSNASTLEVIVSAHQDEESIIDSKSVATSVSGAAANGIAGGISVAGTSSVNRISNKTLATIEDSSLYASSVGVTADSHAEINAKILNASVATGFSVSSAGGLGLGINDVHNIIGDSSHDRSQPAKANQVIAMIKGDTTVEASGAVTVLATNKDVITAAMNADVVSAAGSSGFSPGVAGAGAAAYNTVASEIVAAITGTTPPDGSNVRANVNSGGNVRVVATDESDVNTIVGTVTVSAVVGNYGAGASISVSKAESEVGNLVEATIEQATVAAAQDIAVRAVEKTHLETYSYTTSVGATIAFGGNITGGGAVAYGLMDSEVRSRVVNSDLSAGAELSVTSQSNAEVDSDTKPLGVSVVGLAAAGSVPTAIIKPTVESLFSLSSITADDLRVEADFYPIATADAAGIQVAVGATVAASDATVEVGGKVTAAIATGSNLVDVDRLTIDSAMAPVRQEGGNTFASFATANASSGGILLGTNSAYSESIDTSQVIARIGDGSSNIRVGTSSTVQANSANLQRAESDAYSGGLLGVGVPTAIVENSLTTKATIGTGVNIDGGSLKVIAEGHSNALSDANAGTGGVAAASVSQSKVDNRSVTEAGIGVSTNNLVGPAILKVDSLTIEADFLTQTNAVLGAVAGGVLSGQGGFVYNDVHSNVLATVGARSEVMANTIDIDANQRVVKPDLGTAGNVDATTGGLVTGGGVGSHTSLILNTEVDIGSDTTLSAIGGDTAILALAAANSIDATDRLTARTGGVGAQAHVDSSIIANTMRAVVDIAEGATLSSSGTIDVAATGTADVQIQANSTAGGVVTIGSGTAEITLLPRNQIDVNQGARLIAARDVNLRTGIDTYDAANYDLEARMDTFGGSLIPLEFINGIARVLENNKVAIASGAAIESNGNIRLQAERYGFNQVDGVAKAVNWVSGLDSGISSLSAEGGVEQSTGVAISKAFGAVTVDGSVRTGRERHQELLIRDFAYSGSGDTDSAENYLVDVEGNIPFAKRVETVVSTLHQDLTHAKEQLSEYSSNRALREFYESEVERLERELREQALLVLEVPREGSSSSPRQVAAERKTLVISVRDVYAEAGEIQISGDRLVGSGVLDAPGDASVRITNESLATIQLGGVEIADSTGGVLFNTNFVSEASGGNLNSIRDAIEAENQSNLDIAFLLEPEYAASAQFSKVVGGAGAPAPTISVRNTASTTTVDGTVYPWPNIRVEDAPLRNIGGSVELFNHASGAGSIIITTQIAAAELSTRAGNQGTATISLPGASSIYEVGGSEFANIHKELYATHTKKGIVPLETQEGSNNSFTRYLSTEPTTPSIIASRIFVEAHFINVNGLIQSGKSDFNLTIGEEVAREIAARKAEGATGVRILSEQPSEDFVISYDFDRSRILVSELTVGGGYVELTGNIANTRQGEIRVFGGYANINIDNQTKHDIELHRIDAGRRGQGTLIINDLARGDGTTPESYHYVRKGDVIEQSRFLLNGQTHREVFGLDDDAIYLPNPGLRYGWSVVEDRSTEIRRTYRSSSWLGAIDEFSPDSDTYTQTGPTTLSAAVHGSGAYFYQGSATSRPRYTYAARPLNGVGYPLLIGQTPPPWRLIHEWTEWTGALLWAEEHHYSKWAQTYRDQMMHEHSIRADRAIDIEFIGEEQGNIDIQSNGDVYISGVIDNSAGYTRIQVNESDIFQGTEQGLLRTHQLQFSPRLADIYQDATQRLGTNSNPLLVDQTQVQADFSSSEKPGELQPVLRSQRVRVAVDHAAGGTPGSVYAFLGLREEVDLSQENFGDVERWVAVEESGWAAVWGNGVGNQELSLAEVNGDLRLKLSRLHALSLSALGNILPAVGIERDALLVDQITLTSTAGSVGTAVEPFAISGNVFSPSVNVVARDDVYLASHTSNIGIDSIAAEGHVQIDAYNNARVEDINDDEIEDTRAIEEITQAVWVGLQLTEEFGAGAKRQERITALESIRTRDYQTYWRYRNSQTDPSVYDSEHRITLTDEERDFYGDEDEIATIENARTQQYHDLHPSMSLLTETHDPDFRYQATQEELNGIDQEKVWTIEELTSLSQPYGVLGVSDTEFVVEEPNISAQSVTINSAKGIGSFRNGAVVALDGEDGSAELTLRERALIAAAEHDDLYYLSEAPVYLPYVLFDPSGLQLACCEETWADYGMEVGQSIYIQSDNFAVEGRLFEIVKLDGSRMEVDADDIFLGKWEGTTATIGIVIPDPQRQDEATHLMIVRREDVDIDSPGPIVATSEHNVFLGSEGNLHLDRIHAGTVDYEARVEIRATGSLLNAASVPNQPNVIGGRVLLESALGSIGSHEVPLRLALTENHTLIARADDELAITQSNATEDADLRVAELFSRNEQVQVTASGSILDAFTSPVTKIQAAGVVLNAGRSIGTVSNPLEINLTNTGTLTAVANEDIIITETVGDLDLRQVLSQMGNVYLVADISILDTIDVEDASDPQSPNSEQIDGLPRIDIVGHHVSLTANFGAVGTAGNEVDIDSNFSGETDNPGSLTTSSSGNTHIIETIGDLYLGRIETDDETAFMVAPTGSIYSGLARDEMNVYAGKLWLFAADDIGTSGMPLESSATAIEGIATTGSVYIDQSGPVEIGGVRGDSAEGENGSFEDGFFAGQNFSISGDDFTLTERIEVSGWVSLSFDDAFWMPSGSSITASDAVYVQANNIHVESGAVIASGARVTFQGVPTENEDGASVLVSGSLFAGDLIIVSGSNRDDIINLPMEEASGQVMVFGGEGDDRLFGSRYDDTLRGDAGNDTIDGRLGCDVMQGGEGLDAYQNVESCDFIGTLRSTINDIAEDILDNSVVGTLEMPDLDPGDSLTFRVLETDSPFAIQGNELIVTDASKLNRRANAIIPVTIAADHAQGGTTVEQFSVRLTADNDAPFAIELSHDSVIENELAAAIGELTFSDPDIDDAHTVSVNDERFEVIDGLLKLKPGQSLNHEVEPRVDLVITVEDLSGASTERSVGIDVLNDNDLPTRIELIDLAMLENLEEMPIGTLEIFDEDADAAYDILIDHAQLEIDGITVRLKSGQFLSRSEAEELSFAITIVDQSEPDIRLTSQFQFAVQSNEAAWQNSSSPLDVNGDGFVSPIDVLLVVNALNSQSVRDSIPMSGNSFPTSRVFTSEKPFLDTSGDSFLSPIDALLVINRLNEDSQGEGDSIYAMLMPFPQHSKKEDLRHEF